MTSEFEDFNRAYLQRLAGVMAVPAHLLKRRWVKPSVRKLEAPAEHDFSPENEG